MCTCCTYPGMYRLKSHTHLWRCMFTCMCMHSHAHTRACTHTHTHTHTHVCMHTYTHTHTCIHIRHYLYMHIHLLLCAPPMDTPPPTLLTILYLIALILCTINNKGTLKNPHVVAFVRNSKREKRKKYDYLLKRKPAFYFSRPVISVIPISHK